MVISSANEDQFSKFFHFYIPKETKTATIDFTVINSYRVLSVDSADLIAHASIFLEVEVLICVAFCNISQTVLDVVLSKLVNFDK